MKIRREESWFLCLKMNIKQIEKIVIQNLKQFWYDPSDWWQKRHWFGKFTSAIILVMFISISSVGFYQKSIQKTQQELLKIQSQAIESLNSTNGELQKELNSLKTSKTEDEIDIFKQLVSLREELVKYKSQQEGRDQILGLATNSSVDEAISSLDKQLSNPSSAETLPIAQGIVKLLENSWEKVDVFEEARASSKIIGEAVTDKLYFIYDSKPNWYKIEITDDQFGWIQSQFVMEL